MVIASTSSAGRHRLRVLRRLLDRLAQALEVGLDGRRAVGVALGQLVLEVGERGRRTVAERDRLLDLEVERDLRAADAAVVLDRHEREEAQQLLGAARGLLGRERRGGEALERLADLRARRPVAVGVAARGAAGQRGERRAGRLRARGVAVLGVARREDRPVAGGLRGGLRVAGGEAALERRVGVAQQLAQAALVGVEQVLGDRLARRPRA